MSRIPAAVLALGLALGSAACGGDRGGTATVRDTTITTVPDTVLIERTTTVDVDTVRNPDLDRDTVRRDTVPGARNP
jgi:hypothetical protein